MERKIKNITYELTYKRVKNINMRIGSDGIVKVSAPFGADERFIDDFVWSRRRFIKEAKERTDSRSPVPEPDATPLEIYKRLYAVYKDIYNYCFSECGFDMPKLRIRAMKSQWGNCRRERGLITLNSYLYSLPDRYVEFIAAHELSHMLEPNHSRAFYNVLSAALPDHREREAELKRWKIT